MDNKGRASNNWMGRILKGGITIIEWQDNKGIVHNEWKDED